jgi:hypothetical protein
LGLLLPDEGGDEFDDFILLAMRQVGDFFKDLFDFV